MNPLHDRDHKCGSKKRANLRSIKKFLFQIGNTEVEENPTKKK